MNKVGNIDNSRLTLEEKISNSRLSDKTNQAIFEAETGENLGNLRLAAKMVAYKTDWSVPWNVGTIFLELSTNVVFCFWLLLFSRSQALFVKAQNLKYQYIIMFQPLPFLCKNLFEKSVGKIAWINTCT